MKKFIPLLIIVVMVSGMYFGLKESGIFTDFDDAIHERNGWRRIGTAQYVKYETEIKKYVHYSVLRDPEAKGIQVLEGAIKKDALDRMIYSDSSIIEVTGMKEETIKKDLTLIAKAVNCNTVIINGRSHSVSTVAKGFGLGG